MAEKIKEGEALVVASEQQVLIPAAEAAPCKVAKRRRKRKKAMANLPN